MKLVLLCSFLIGGNLLAYAKEIVSSDRFLLKILDRTISTQDIRFQLRNLKALQCIDSDALVIQYFDKSFITELDKFLKDLPKDDEAVRIHLHGEADLLKKIRWFFKILRYSEDQKAQITPQLSQIIREGTKENKCDREVLYKDTLKTNFISLLRMELYFRARYGSQLKSSNHNFSVVRSSIDIFVESLDKQFLHEYYW